MRWCCYSLCVWYADFAQREGSRDLALFNQSQCAFTLAPFNCKLVDHNITSSQLRLSLFFNMLTICFFSIQYWVEKHNKLYPICFKFQATQVFLGGLHSNWQLYSGKWVWYIEPSIVIQKSKFSVFLSSALRILAQVKFQLTKASCYARTVSISQYRWFYDTFWVPQKRYLNCFIITHYYVRVMWNISWFLMGRLLFLSLFSDTCGTIKSWGNSCRQECMDYETWEFQWCKSSRDAHIAWQALNLGWWDGAWLLVRISDYGLCRVTVQLFFRWVSYVRCDVALQVCSYYKPSCKMECTSSFNPICLKQHIHSINKRDSRDSFSSCWSPIMYGTS